MNVSEKDKKHIDESIRDNRNRLYGREIYIFGCTLFGRVLRDALIDNECSLKGFIDNNQDKIGKPCLNVPVYSPHDILHKYNQNILIVICSKYQQEMLSQIYSYGYDERNVLVIDVKESKNHIDDSLLEAEKSIEYVKKGLKIYNNVISNNASMDKVFVCPYPGTGDIYMSCIYLPRYLDIHSIRNYSMIVPSEGCRKVCELFGITSVQVMPKEDIDTIIRAWEFLGSEIINIKVLLHWGWRCKKFLFSDNHPQICFSDMFIYDVYKFPDETNRVYPQKYENIREIEKYFYDNSLKIGKTVILAPYAGSFASEIPAEFWEGMADQLSKCGYTVCTNCGNDSEIAINGTIRVTFPYKWAIDVTELAGIFIGLRSGLCDIVSSAKCKLVILYESGFNASSIGHFGISKMGLNRDAFDVEYENINKTTYEILKFCCEK